MFELSTDLTCNAPLHGGLQWYWVRTRNMPATIRYLYHSATAATGTVWQRLRYSHVATYIGNIGNEQVDDAARSATIFLPLALPCHDVILNHLQRAWHES
ncbi:hypothetical protein TNCV_1902881 [Trichonephila clavipes]|nr:hypothetical protein TNCV_1902881 [Trichonephila clavipes]